jgi:hypothetical protein
VCLVLALTVIRKHANKYGCNLGPVVMLSYKNHALDEFLSDVVEHAPRALLSRNPTDFLVRCGRPENEQLLPHSEKNSPAERHWQGVLAERIAEERKTKLEVVEWHSTAKTLLFVDSTEQVSGEEFIIVNRTSTSAFLTALVFFPFIPAAGRKSACSKEKSGSGHDEVPDCTGCIGGWPRWIRTARGLGGTGRALADRGRHSAVCTPAPVVRAVASWFPAPAPLRSSPLPELRGPGSLLRRKPCLHLCPPACLPAAPCPRRSPMPSPQMQRGPERLQ